MANASLMSSLNWRFYSVLLILSVTLFMLGYNTFIINKIDNSGARAVDVMHSRMLSSPSVKAWTQVNQQQQRHDQIDQKHNNDNTGDDNNIYFHPDGYIIGNPLLRDECKNAVTSQIPDRLFQFFPDLLPSLLSKHWFVSRESYATLFSHSHRENHYKSGHSKRKPLEYFSKTKIQSVIAKGFNNSQTTSYFNIEKAASSTTGSYLQRQKDEYEFEQNIVDSNLVIHSNCSFTFVRDPLQRFISGYYTVNRLMWDVEHNPDRVSDHAHIATLRHLFKFLSMEGEPDRFRAFVDDLSVFESLFIFGSRHLQHIMSQSAILSLPNLSQIGKTIEWFTHPENGNLNDRFFVGKVEQYEEHWRKLMEVCDDVVMYEKDLQLMPSYGARESLNTTYLNVMSLENWKKGQTLPAYYALDEITFAKIVNFYYQDYVCFGYEPIIPDLDPKDE